MTASAPSIDAPIAKKISHQMTHHQHQRQDDYYWMRDDERTDPEILAHLAAENTYCEQQLAAQKPLQEKIFNELKQRIAKDDNTVPAKDGDYWYHSEISGEQEFSRYYRATSFDGDNKQLLVDVNQLASSHEYFELGEFSISPNDKILSYSQDIDGRRIYSVKFKDIASNQYLSDELHDTEGQVVWCNDNKTVFYVKKDSQTLLGTQVYRHVLGTSQIDDVLVFEEDDHSFYMSLSKSRDESLIFIGLHATQTSDTWFIDASDSQAEFEQLVEFEEEHEYDADKLGDTFYIVTNWRAINFRLMSATSDTIFKRDQWLEVVAHRDDVLLEGIELFNQFLVVTERELGQIRFIIHPKDGASYPLTFDDPCYDACLGDNPEPSASSARVYYS
ncbi:MAG: S9 family peptidase, partial [Psychrobium sp.]|nr:S9 family peptidase [Psychrobium sp.]